VSMLNQTGTPSWRSRRVRCITSTVAGIQVRWPDCAVIVTAWRLRVSRSAMGATSRTERLATALRMAPRAEATYWLRASKNGLEVTSACTFSVGSSCCTSGTTMRQSPSSSAGARQRAKLRSPSTTHSEMPPVTARLAEPAPRRATSESCSGVASQP
jgi:hypothetical protein